jgi:hypothetical protein
MVGERRSFEEQCPEKSNAKTVEALLTFHLSLLGSQSGPFGSTPSSRLAVMYPLQLMLAPSSFPIVVGHVLLCIPTREMSFNASLSIDLLRYMTIDATSPNTEKIQSVKNAATGITWVYESQVHH